jgi:hypothetical protein
LRHQTILDFRFEILDWAWGMGQGALVIGVFKEGGSLATSSIRDLNDLTNGC